MKRDKIPLRSYSQLAVGFNPTAFDARAWARAAKAAGARYVVITTKHHDGFAMFASKVDRYNVQDSTPFGRDPIRELVTAARAEGLRVGFYYSQVQDWADKDAVGNDWDFPDKGRRFQAYLDRKAIPQIRELLTKYGKIDVVWFDTPIDARPGESKKLYELVKSLQPDCLVSGRIGNGFGDFTTYGDGEVPTLPPTSPPWEAIFTHNDSWGFSKLDRNFKSARELIRTVATVASRGGNTLINIGPDAMGRMPTQSTDRLAVVGDWLRINGASIYGTSAASLPTSQWGVATMRDAQVFLHVFARPSDGRLVVPGVVGDPERVTFLATGKRLSWRRMGGDLTITLPPTLPDERDTVIVLDRVRGTASVDAGAILSAQYPNLTLSPATATLTGAVKSKSLGSYGYFGDWKHFETLLDMKAPVDTAAWTIRVDEPGEYQIDLVYSAPPESAGQEGVLEAGDQSFAFQVLETGTVVENRLTTFATQGLGSVRFTSPGRQRIVLRPRLPGKGNLFLLKNLVLTPVK